MPKKEKKLVEIPLHWCKTEYIKTTSGYIPIHTYYLFKDKEEFQKFLEEKE